jgi:hypothetical protein
VYGFVCQSSATRAQPISLKQQIEDTLDDTVITSTKQPKQLRCDVVNDITSNGVSVAAFSALPNVRPPADADLKNMDVDNAMFDCDHMQLLYDPDGTNAREPGIWPASFERANFFVGGRIEKELSLILQDSSDVTLIKF